MKIKHSFALLFCLILALCLISCNVDLGGNGGDTTSSSEETVTDSTPQSAVGGNSDSSDPSQEESDGSTAPSSEDTNEPSTDLSDTTESSEPSADSSDTTDSSETTDSSKPNQDKDDTPEKYTVTFVTNCGDVIEPVLVKDGKKVPTPVEINKPGYTFDGWYLDDVEWVFVGYVVTEDITLVAKWIPNENTITFDANGGEGTMENMIVATDSTTYLSANKFTKAGYTFLGWSTSLYGYVKYNDCDEYRMGTEPSYTLYAQWKATENTIVFDANGGEGKMENLSVLTNSTKALSLNTFTRNGYSFIGWSTSKAGSVEFVDGANYKMGTEPSNTLYAVWEADVYTITYKRDGGTGELKENFTIEDLPLALCDLADTESGAFGGWYKESDFSGAPVFEITELGNVTLFAHYLEYTEGIVFSETDGTYVVTGYEGSAKNVVIPKTYNGKYVVAIGSEAFLDKRITSVVIPDSVTTISNNAFYKCYWLVEVYNFSNLKLGNENYDNGRAGYYAISIYTSLKEKSKVFTNDDGFIFYEDGESRYLVGYEGSETDIVLPNDCNGKTYEINARAFRDNESLTSVEISKNVTSIGYAAFEACTSLTSIAIPNSVTTISTRAFASCSMLENVELSNSVTMINANAFSSCNKLTNVNYIGTIEQWCNITFGGSYANPASYNLHINGEPLSEELVIPDGITVINAYTFEGCKSIKSVVIPNSVTTIANYAFSNCSSLESIEIPNSVTTIANYAFSNCSSLESIEIPNSVTSIGKSAFSYCKSLKSIAIPSSVTSIETYSFYSCQSLESVEMSDNVNAIGNYAFSGCTALKSIVIPVGVTSIGEYAFSDCYKLSLNCEAAKPLYNWAKYWNYSNRPVVWSYNHSYVDEVILEPTHITTGQIKYSCQDCGLTYIDTIAKILEHTHVNNLCICGDVRPTTIETNEENGRKDVLPKLFDGSIECSGIFGDRQNVWYGSLGEYVLLTFEEEITISEMAMYLCGNWTWADVEFMDATGEVIHTVTGDSYDHRIVANNAMGPDGTRHTVFQESDIGGPLTVKYIKITVASLKYSGAAYSYLISEIELIAAMPKSTEVTE